MSPKCSDVNKSQSCISSFFYSRRDNLRSKTSDKNSKNRDRRRSPKQLLQSYRFSQADMLQSLDSYLRVHKKQSWQDKQGKSNRCYSVDDTGGFERHEGKKKERGKKRNSLTFCFWCKPFLRTFSMMRTSWSATGSFFSSSYIFE